MRLLTACRSSTKTTLNDGIGLTLRVLPACGLVLVMAASLPAHGAPPFAGDPNADTLPPKPETRAWTVKQGKVATSFLFEPGIPDPNQTTTITFVPTQLGRTVATHRPIEGIKFVVTVKDPDGKVLGRYLAHPNPLSKSKYGLHYTPLAAGVHTLEVQAKLADGSAFDTEVKFPVGVWPLPPELEGTGDKVAGGAIKRPLGGPVTK